ncbi:MAG: REP-associated tyrosine transposase [Pelotomaculum sp.]|jgi:putative transposase
MARKPRQFSDTGIYHVMLRGNERKNIFQDDGHKRRFLDGIDAKRKEADFAVYAYCIMDNHVHLLINIKEQDLSSIMKGIAVRYAVFYNWHQSRVGHVFQDRFKSETIQDDRHLLAAVRYIHNNPVKAGMVEKAADYRWSSYAEYLQPKSRDWLDTEFVLSIFSDNGKMALKEFERFSLQVDNSTFMDIEEDKTCRTIEEGRAYLSDYLRERYNGMTIEQIKEDRQKQTEIIRHLRTNTSLSQRVIASLLGINKSAVEKVKTD